ncbi:ABC transporter permease [Sphingomonas changnyeongensis]|uniref:ABC transporter permease n=1 Tax=Sphingomonas changnyeongensis TaxID=2698679 RepID=A0A7Z2NYK9_9SPHN|nr:ABC transporter permease [Sphingomonas changnyeongensis]
MPDVDPHPPARQVYVREAWAEIVKSARLPQFIIPTIALPPAFYALFALAIGQGSAEVATRNLATFGVFAVMGPALFGFGANIAAERESGQLELKRLSPMPAGAQISARVVATTAFSALAFLLIYTLGVMGGVRLSAGQWAMLAMVHTLAVIPFALIGLGIGYRLGQKGAIAVANIVFLAMAVLGGLWMPIAVLPQAMQTMAWALPSYHLGEIALMATGRGDGAQLWLHAGPLLLITAAAGLFAWTGERGQAA